MVLAERLNREREPQVRAVRVRVKGGYEPAVVHARAGEPLRLVFSREETASCSEHVVIPAFGVSAMLPAFQDVEIELLPERAGEFEFTCQMGMLRGRLVVSDDGEHPASRGLAGRLRAQWTGRTASDRGDTVLLALVGWLCSLPLLLLVTVPFLGWRAGALAALIWFGVVAGACFAVCLRRARRPPSLNRRTA